MHLEVLTEDKSGGVVLDNLLKNILTQRKYPHTYAIRPHRGKGYNPDNPFKKPARFASGLLDLLPAKLRAYAATNRPEQLLLLIVLDSDAEDPQKIHDEIEQIVLRFGNNLPAVIGISVEEIESWLLGDPAAIMAAYPKADLTKAGGYRQDSICGTWEILAFVLAGQQAGHMIRIGYPAVGQIKNEWASKIAPHLDPKRNQSPSFQSFYRSLLRNLGQQELLLARQGNEQQR